MKFLFPLTLFVVLLSACPKVATESGNQLGEIIEVPINEPITIPSENISIILSDVKESRCPKDVNCIQAGKAVVHIDFAIQDAVYPLKITAKGMCYELDGSCGSTQLAQGYSVKLLAINPYPIGNQKPDRNYIARIQVTKKEM